MKSRRKFIKSSLLGLTALTFPNIIKVNADQDYDVVVIGAGAAGLAATEELIRSGKKVICLEASNRIGGRALTDNQIFGEPYDLGALWLDNGETNPFKIYAEKNSKFNIYKERAEEIYNGNKKTSQEDELWKLYDGVEAAIAKTRKDVAPIDVVPNQDHRWFDTVHLQIGAWEMGKDFTKYSCKDFNYDYEIGGGGIFFKMSNFLFGNNYLFYFFIFITFLFLYDLTKNFQNFLLLLCLLLSNPQYSIYHKYFDPLILIIWFLLFIKKGNFQKNYFKKENILIFYLFYLTFICLNYFKSFI